MRDRDQIRMTSEPMREGDERRSRETIAEVCSMLMATSDTDHSTQNRQVSLKQEFMIPQLAAKATMSFHLLLGSVFLGRHLFYFFLSPDFNCHGTHAFGRCRLLMPWQLRLWVSLVIDHVAARAMALAAVSFGILLVSVWLLCAIS